MYGAKEGNGFPGQGSDSMRIEPTAFTSLHLENFLGSDVGASTGVDAQGEKNFQRYLGNNNGADIEVDPSVGIRFKRYLGSDAGAEVRVNSQVEIGFAAAPIQLHIEDHLPRLLPLPNAHTCSTWVIAWFAEHLRFLSCVTATRYIHTGRSTGKAVAHAFFPCLLFSSPEFAELAQSASQLTNHPASKTQN
jgi:hypothetical protein